MYPEQKRTQRDYSLAFKLTVVDQVEKGEMTCTQAQDHYGIQGNSTVLTWLRKHGRLNWSRGASNHQARPGVLMSAKKMPVTPEQRIKELERELAVTRQKAEFFEAVVDVLKKDYGVKVIKKQHGRSSKKRSLPG